MKRRTDEEIEKQIIDLLRICSRGGGSATVETISHTVKITSPSVWNRMAKIVERPNSPVEETTFCGFKAWRYKSE